MTVGNAAHGVVHAYPVLLAQHMVRSLGIELAYVRNLGVGAAHGAVVPALCCDNLLSMELSTMAPHDMRAVRLQVINRSQPNLAPTALHIKHVPRARFEPADIILIEFSINGIAWLDVLLARLRQMYPDAMILYVDHFRLIDWRNQSGVAPTPNVATPSKGVVKTPNGKETFTIWQSKRMSIVQNTTWLSDWQEISLCTPQLAGYLQAARARFWSVRQALGARGASYPQALKYFSEDKTHLNQKGHALVASGTWATISSRDATWSRGRCGFATLAQERLTRLASSIGRGREDASLATHAPTTTMQCYLWYRTKRLPREMAIAYKHPNWSMRGQLVASHGDGGKFTYELKEPAASTPEQVLTLRFPVKAAGSVVRIAHMLHCCMYGVAELLIDGEHAAYVEGSAPGFPYHVLDVVAIGRVPTPGSHNLTLRVVRAGGPDGSARQFRLAGLFVGTDDAITSARKSVYRGDSTSP